MTDSVRGLARWYKPSLSTIPSGSMAGGSTAMQALQRVVTSTELNIVGCKVQPEARRWSLRLAWEQWRWICSYMIAIALLVFGASKMLVKIGVKAG